MVTQSISAFLAFYWRVAGRLFAWSGVLLLMACGSPLPKGEGSTEGPWKSYEEAQHTFDLIVPHKTTTIDLKQLNLDPHTNPNITILNYADVIRRFIPSYSINTNDLDAGVLECIMAKTSCQGYEIDYRVVKRNRYGNFVVDYLNFNRKVDVVGWRFNAVLLVKDNTVIYKLTGGQPAIHEREENTNPLGPFQGSSESGSLTR